MLGSLTVEAAEISLKLSVINVSWTFSLILHLEWPILGDGGLTGVEIDGHVCLLIQGPSQLPILRRDPLLPRVVLLCIARLHFSL